jgi:uncharacterized membrane-anchored protein YitT (DUF2179 family)
MSHLILHCRGTHMKMAALVLGIIFLILAIVYFVIPAGSLPGFLPGFEAGSEHTHVKHAVAALVVAVVLFAISWYAGRNSR